MNWVAQLPRDLGSVEGRESLRLLVITPLAAAKIRVVRAEA